MELYFSIAMELYASIDIGTNAVRLLIASIEMTGVLKSIIVLRRISRLGEGLSKTGTLSQNAIDRTIGVLKEYRGIIEENKVINVIAAATSAVREAINSYEFLRMAKDVLGVNVEVISGEKEARLTLLGALSSISPKPESALVIDIGGGSTEFIYSKGSESKILFSTPLGVVYLTEKFLTRDPIDPKEFSLLEREISHHILQVKEAIYRNCGINKDFVLIVNGGTATTLAAIDKNLFRYEYGKLHNHSLSYNKAKEILEDIKSKSLAERKTMPQLEPGREDIIIAGTVILVKTMELFQIDIFLVCEAGLKEGLILSGYIKRGEISNG